MKEEPAQPDSSKTEFSKSSFNGYKSCPKPVVPKSQTSTQIPAVTDTNASGFIDKLFGGGNSVAKFAKETKSLELGLFARKPTISKNVEKFSVL